MNKLLLYGLITLGSGFGAWIPSLWHAGYFSVAGIIGGVFGSVAGILAYKALNDYIDI